MDKRRRDSLEAEAAFRQRLEQLGAELLEPEWRGLSAKHHVRCHAGHDCHPTPASVRRGQGICLRCARRSPADAEAAFRSRLAELGAELLEPYVNSKTGHLVRCAAGHECHPRPNTLASTPYGICSTCARNDPRAAEAAFRERLAGMGATPLYERWQGNQHPYPVRCASGHICRPRPNDIQQGDGICRTCAGVDSAMAEAAFVRRLDALGATSLYGEWRGTKPPHHVRCNAGHDCYPRPGDVLAGQGICRKCANRIWDAFYVVTSADGVKFGVTSGDARLRLKAHARRGYRAVERLLVDLPGTTAHDTENAIRAALADAGEKPLRGREYFAISCLALVLDVADSWLALPAPAAA